MQAITKTTASFSLFRTALTVARCSCLGRTKILRPSRSYCAASNVLEPPAAEGQMKQYDAKIQQIVTQISQLTLIEVADLNDLLKKTLNISDAPVMMGAMSSMGAASAAEEEAQEVKKEKVIFNVKLTAIDGGKKVQIIKEIKNIVPGMNLVQAKKFVESLPQTIKSDISKDEAEKLKETLAAVGGNVEIE